MKAAQIRMFTCILVTFLFLTFFNLPVYANSIAQPQSPSGIAISDLETEINAFMDNHIGKSTPGVSVSVVKDGKIVFSQGYGYGDVEGKVPVTTETVMEYGSISKLFVWTSVMQLVEQEKIDLDADIRTYLPESFNKKWHTVYPVTMNNILNHSSGFGEYPFDLIEKTAPEKEQSLSDLLLNAHPKQYFKPGTASVYSNYATALAGYVVECISGEPFYAYQKSHIFDKTEMSDSAGQMAWLDNPSILDHKAKGHIPDGKGGFIASAWSYVGLYPAGSVNGTADDLARFMIALMPQQGEKSPLFIKDSTVTTMLSPSYEGTVLGTAHGFFEYDAATGQAFGHGGNTLSFSSQLAFSPEDGFGFVVLTNAGRELEITTGLHDLLMGNDMANKTSAKKSLIDVSIFQGIYVSMRRPEGTPLEGVSYLSYLSVESANQNTVVLSIYGYSATYLQTAPYTFELIDSTHPLFRIFYSKLIFHINAENKPTQISFGHGMDYSTLPNEHSPSLLLGNVVTLLVTFFFFLIMFVITIIQIVKRRKKTKIERKGVFQARAILVFTGVALFVSNIVMLLSFLTNTLSRYSQAIPFAIANYLLAALGLGSIIWGIAEWNKERKKRTKVWFVLTGIMVVSLVSLLASWNFFVILF